MQDALDTGPPGEGGAPGPLARIDPSLGAILLLFLLLTVPRLGAVPVWDSRVYYDLCLLDNLDRPFHPLNFNCFGHPSMLYMLLFVPGQLISEGSAVLLNLTNVALGCLAIAAFWIITGVLWRGPGSRGDRLLATAILAVWPAALANSLSFNPDYGVFVFLLFFVAALIRGRIGLAAFFGAFLVFSKEAGVVLYGLTSLLYLILFARGITDSGRPTWSRIREHAVLFVPALLYLANIGLTLARDQPVIWGGAGSLTQVFKRFVFFNPGEIYAGRYGPLIWVLNMSWILTACLLAAGLKLALSRSARQGFRSKALSQRPLVFVLLVFAATTYALTRYETYSHARYLLAIAPFFILAFVISLRILFPRSGLRYAFLGATFLLLLASDFRTIDPVSRRLWGTFSFGRHQLLRLTSWNNECCGYSMDQLVYNLEYLKFDEVQSAIFADIRPTWETTFVGNERAELMRPGAVTPEGKRTLRLSDDIVWVRYWAVNNLLSQKALPDAVFFVALPNVDNGPDLERLRRTYSVVSRKTYERSGYAIPVYTMQHRTQLTAAIAVFQQPGQTLKSR